MERNPARCVLQSVSNVRLIRHRLPLELAEKGGYSSYTPDNDPTGVASTLTLPPGGEIGKLEVELEIDHTWVGDLIVELEHPNGTTVRLVNLPNCSGENIDTVLDDDAALSIQDDCQDDDPAYPAARYRPANVLSGFNNLPVGGTWTLTVSDNAPADTGVLRRWCLVPTTASGEIFSDRFEQ
ncbi:MAG: hypothetical protein EA370_14585 [Wenzhouxiangella sp.]|nr:MAG: hypothetical protein EA370_14585 [Wenzhouxiangella sp.]